MEFTSTTQGKRKLADGGFLYVYQKGLANGVESWECEQRRRQTCKARVKVQNDIIIDRVNDHTHAPDPTKIEITKIRVAMKRRAETTIDAPQRILSDGLAQASAAAAVNLPRFENVSRTIRRYREGDPGLPANPQNRANVPVIPNDLQLTNNGNRFLLYDSGVGDANRIIIFATDQCLDLLRQSDHWFGDGTFAVSPAIFFQVYTIHAICNGKVVPCVYALLPNKAGPTYDRLFREIDNHLNGHIPTDILFDFEQAAMNSARNVFVGVNVKGCFFHLSQNIWKKIQQNGLAVLYENDDEFSILMRMIAALAFVPEVDVPQAFYDVENEIRNNYNNNNGIDVVIDYFEDTYVGRQRRGRPRANPMFPLNIWNMNARTQDELPRTNNHVEGWHRRFSGNCDCLHPNIWKFIRSLQREESLVCAEVHQVLGGHPVVQKKKYAQCAERVKNVVNTYAARRANILGYLRAIAHNLSF